MSQNGESRQALAIAERMQQQYDAFAPKGQEKDKYDKQIFDIVLNLNSLNEQKGGLSQLKQQKEEEAEMDNCLSNAYEDEMMDDYGFEMRSDGMCVEADYGDSDCPEEQEE